VPDSELLSYLVIVAAFDAGRASVCQDELAQALAKHPESARIQVMKARCAARDGDRKEALEVLEAAVRLGFKQLDVIERAADFADLVALPEFSDLKERVRQKEKEEEKEEEDRRRS
jgi:hypothetical protein